jgi:hypothetical protein
MGTSARPRLVCHSLWHTDGAAARRLAVDSRQTNHADFRSYRFGENAGYLLTGYNDAPQRFGSGGRAICETKLVPASLATYLKMNGSVGLPNSSIAKSVPSCRPPTESLARYRKLMQRSHKIGESGDRRNVWTPNLGINWALRATDRRPNRFGEKAGKNNPMFKSWRAHQQLLGLSVPDVNEGRGGEAGQPTALFCASATQRSGLESARHRHRLTWRSLCRLGDTFQC